MAEAVAVLRINTTAYPRSSNAHDSLGEALAAIGDVPEAIRSYERAVELDPANANAIARLRALRGGGR
jgi:cytochrome c-type biogenesis protein CcmH/NrfG